jgi:hypothetical protein
MWAYGNQNKHPHIESWATWDQDSHRAHTAKDRTEHSGTHDDHNAMRKMIPTKTFLLRKENRQDVIAKRGQAIDVTEEELKKLKGKFAELPKQQQAKPADRVRRG